MWVKGSGKVSTSLFRVFKWFDAGLMVQAVFVLIEPQISIFWGFLVYIVRMSFQSWLIFVSEPLTRDQ